MGLVMPLMLRSIKGSMQRTSNLASRLEGRVEDGAFPGDVEVAIREVSIETMERGGWKNTRLDGHVGR